MGTSFIHRKALTLPVCGRTKFAQLLYNTSAVFFSPLPALIQELFTGQVRLIDALLFKL